MDTKLKNSRNVRIGIIIIGLLLAVGVNVSLFPWMIRDAEQKSVQLFSSSENVNTEYIDTLYQGAYVLYTEIKNEPSESRTEPFVGEGSGYDDYDYISEWSSSFEGVRSETDYYATEGAKKEVNANAPLYEVLEPDFRIDDDKEQWNSYESVFVLDFDEDGVDELFWGERLISLDDGHELFCGDKGRYIGHSDIVVPFVDDQTGKKYIFTCREDYEQEGEPRVVTYDAAGTRAWTAVPSVGHMHNAWLANVGDKHRKIAMSMRITRRVINNAIVDTEPEDFYFDAVSGDELHDIFPFTGHEFMPVDFNGDGNHEFYGTAGQWKGYVLDAQGNCLGFVGGDGVVRSGKVINAPGETLMVYYAKEGKVRIWGDMDAVESAYCHKRFAHPYHKRMQHFMGTG